MTESRESLMMLVAGYCERRGWVPVGRRTFDVGEWHVTVNGSKEPWHGLDPWHVMAENARYIGAVLFSAFGGVAGGFKGTEAEFRAALVVVREQDIRASQTSIRTTEE